MKLSILFEDNLDLHDKDEWGDIDDLIGDAIRRGERDPELERFILDQHDSYHAYNYVIDVIEGRWIEGEEIIKKDPGYAYKYAINVIKGRWIEGEEEIKKNPGYAYYYAKNVIKGRWVEGEEGIKKNSYYAYLYARNVLKLNDEKAREWSRYGD